MLGNKFCKLNKVLSAGNQCKKNYPSFVRCFSVFGLKDSFSIVSNVFFEELR